MAAAHGSSPFEDDDGGFDNNNHNNRGTRHFSPGSDGFDGVLAPEGVSAIDHRTASDISSTAAVGDHRPLIGGIGEVADGIPVATPVDTGRHLQRRRQRQAADGEDGGYSS
ncbi:hypothetical protein GGI21_005063, partial [Coemansia aciculifera]